MVYKKEEYVELSKTKAKIKYSKYIMFIYIIIKIHWKLRYSFAECLKQKKKMVLVEF